jgi:hypothetical protein
MRRLGGGGLKLEKWITGMAEAEEDGGDEEEASGANTSSMSKPELWQTLQQ